MEEKKIKKDEKDIHEGWDIEVKEIWGEDKKEKVN